MRLSGQRPSRDAKCLLEGNGERSAPSSAKRGVAGGGVEAGDLRQIDAENPVEFGPEIEPRLVPWGFALRAGGGWNGVHGGIDLGLEGAEPGLDLGVALPDEPLVMPVGLEGLAQGEEVLGPVVAHESLGDGLPGGPDAAVAMLRQRVGVPLPGEEHGMELEVHLGERLLDVLGVTDRQLDQIVAVPPQRPHGADRLWRPEGAAQQPDRVPGPGATGSPGRPSSGRGRAGRAGH
jgi:hypothetical protein